ncbi:MAG: DUF4058 family protein [Anaerolineae bacterium]|jgi:hypothetical protein|nr:DUF4058 family protein [Anaerolineae bacterium]
MYSALYVQHLLQGPFPQRTDPWGEDDHYFQQLHSGLIAALVQQLMELMLRGYVIGTSFDPHPNPPPYMGEGTGPRGMDSPNTGEGTGPRGTDSPNMGEGIGPRGMDSPNIGEGIGPRGVAESARLGAITATTPLEALWIRDGQTGDLITIIEILSPGNKTLRGISDYADDRHEYLLSGVNFVEIDLTRSIRRATDHDLTRLYAYHLAVYLPHDGLRIIGMAFDQPLKRFALPLKGEVIGVDLALAYQEAYQKRQIAAQMVLDHHYTLARLPFPTLISSTETQALIEQVNAWVDQLEVLKNQSGSL